MALTLIRIAAGIVFIAFGTGKFVDHEYEVDSFRSYGLPDPDLFVYLVGVLEVVGGALLILRRLVPIAAAALACDMIGAIVVSGILEGETVSLTLAPALLLAMLVLLRTELRRKPRPRAAAR
jgi:putative oxidoreductase